MHEKVKKGALHGALLVAALAGGTAVSARAQGYCAAADSNGTVSCTIPSGSYSSTISIPGNAAATYDVSNLGTFNVGSKEFALQVGGGRAAANEPSSVFSVTSSGAITLSGTGSPNEALQVLSMGGNSTSSSAAGGAAGAVTLTVAAPISLNASTGPAYAALAQTIGGQGDASTGKNVNGTAGGFAGDVTATVSGTTISVQTPDNVGGAALFASEVGSIGGDGGDPSNHNANDNAAGGAGGGTGTLTLAISSATLTATGAGALGISAAQAGGNGGWGGNSAVGGAGGGTGAANITLDNATVSAAGADAVNFGQNGGAGGDASQGGNSSISNAGQGGSTGTLAATVTDSTIDAPGGRGLVLTQTGGAGGNGPNGNESDDQWSNAGTGGSTGGISLTFTGGTTGTTISTTGDAAPGVVAKAIGGAGGTTYAGGGGLASNTDVGNGGAGGNASGDTGEVLVESSGTLTITTQGNTSPGIAAIGQGGQGGSAGPVVCFETCTPGAGGSGGRGDPVEVALGSGALITTAGTDAPAVLAQSLGGTGGAAGGASDAEGFEGVTGLASGYGGNSGPVTINLAGGVTLTTTGAEAPGLLVQSVGGQGGSSATVPGGDVAASGVGATATGTTGGAGGNVAGATITSGATITTSGDSSRGIFVQVLSGPGGAGGLASAGFGTANGGPGGANGIFTDTATMPTTVVNSGTITTGGAGAQGILVQAIGGGGGAGGLSSGFFDSASGSATFAGANGGDVAITNDGAVSTSGAVAAAIAAQSIGGGGGDGGASSGVFYSQGGTAGAGGNGGTVTVSLGSSTDLATTGALAHGVLAESIGGSGGSGGNVQASGTVATYVIGGQGGAGGSGGAVTVNAEGAAVHLQGTGAVGILAQSVGGGGGAGGAAYAINAGSTLAMASAVGGAGGSGGAGGDVTVTTANTEIDTGKAPQPATVAVALPVDAIGILAQSISGGGGAGGGASAAAVALGLPVPSGAISVTVTAAESVGGSGGAGGSSAGTVTTTLEDGTAVGTTGAGSIGVLAQNVGGGGGQGGDSSTLSAAIGSENKYATYAGGSEKISVNVAAGGSGATGGAGGDIIVTLGNAAGAVPGSGVTVATTGDYADGVLAQSIGGGGGNAGMGSSRMFVPGNGSSVEVALDLGAKGGAGGAGADVTMNLYPESAVTTEGSGAAGVVAQSIGNGGGNSTGYTFNLSGLQATTRAKVISVGINPTLGIGASGASGGNGGTVTILSEGRIVTLGDDAPGLMLQSIGGGGGIGGSPGQDAAPSGDKTEPLRTPPAGAEAEGNPSPGSLEVAANTALSLGGRGGAAGNGGTINLTEQGSVETSGDYSPGVVAQSIGGGGGKGGSAVVGTEDNSLKSVIATMIVNANVSLGANGGGGSGGGGGAVNLSLNGATIETGLGAAASAGTGFQSFGVLAQSIGAGGGIAVDGTLDPTGGTIIGAGKSGAAGDGGSITIQQTGGAGPNLIATSGDDAIGVLAQSIGGGGGVYGAGSAAPVSNLFYTGNVGVALGAEAGSGNGGDVTFNFPGLAINTTGTGAFGVLAQSIGGGGGLAAVGGSASVNRFGASAGVSGDGGDVTVDLASNGSITTSGIGADGVVAQSIGGGGGVVILPQAGTVPTLTTTPESQWSNSSVGGGGSVSVATHGPITVTGNGAVAILAQSVAGGGGLAMTGSGTAFAGSAATQSAKPAGSVSIDTQASITATGVNGVAVFAQSAGGGNAAGAVTVHLEHGTTSAGGTVEGGSGQGYGVWVDGGNASNTLIVDNGATLTALSGNAINYTGAFGINTGNAGEVAGDSFVLGNGTFTNGGVLALAGPAGSGAYYGPARLTGNLVQSASGAIETDVDFAARRAGHLVVSGNAALGGKIVPHVATVLPHIEVPVLIVDGTVTGTIQGSRSTLFAYDAHDPPSEITLSARSLGFAPAGFGINGNAAEIAAYLEPVFDTATTPELGTLFATLGNLADSDPAGYVNALRELSPRSVLAFASRARAETMAFGDALLGCESFIGTRAILTPTGCAWMEISGGVANQNDGGGYSGFTDSTVNYSVGGQARLAPDWLVGGALGYEHSWLGGDPSTTGKGDAGYAGVSLTREWQGWRFSGALLGSAGSNSTNRIISTIPGFQSTLSGRPNVDTEAALMRADYTFGVGERAYVRPSMTVGVVRVHASSFEESGQRTVGLGFGSSATVSGVFAPAVEFGLRSDLRNDTALRSYVKLGASLPTTSEFRQPVRLEGAAIGAGSFEAMAPTDGTAATVELGVQLFTARGFDARLAYSGAFSGRVTDNTGMLVGTLHF